MRTVSDNFDAALTQRTTTFARVWTITRMDGLVLRLTDHSHDIVDINGHTYSASKGFTSTPVLTSSLSIGSQSVQLTVPLVDLGVTDGDLRHRLFEQATAKLEMINYAHVDYGTMTLFSGVIGRAVLSDKKRATIEVISAADPNLYVAGENYCGNCRNDLGDKNCKVNIFALAANITVTSAIDLTTFSVNTLAGQPDNFFALGQIEWVTGLNRGLVSDVLSSSTGLLSVALFYPMPFVIQAGDTGQLLPGCDKELSTCLQKFNAVVHFRGEPFAPSY